jgi:hypothetical protein
VADNPEYSDERDSQASDENNNDKILEEAKSRFELCSQAENENRLLALDDLHFHAGDQWPEDIKQARALDHRPCLVINKTPQFVQQVTNDQRQNRPAIIVHPVDDKADPETAKIYQGMIRHIEYNSNAEVAYDTAFDSAVKAGWGYWRIITQYASPTSFEQEIILKRIRNPLSVFFDPYSTEPDGSDANFAFVTDDLSEDEYKVRYPDSKLASKEMWKSVGNDSPEWMPNGAARIAEYFYKENVDEVVVQLSNGQTMLKREMADGMIDDQGQPVSILKERVTKVPKICWVKMNGIEILEKTEWLGIYIPIVPVLGTELDINGKRILKGVIRDAKDPARMYNYWASAETEAIALAPRTPFIMAEGQAEGYEDMWENANQRNFAYLPYKPVSLNGTPVPPPQRNTFEPAVQAITNARMLASDDLKATTGIYDAALGAKSNETSGVAIQRRNVQAQTSNFHFIDNLTRSLRHTGRILIDLIPKIYDTARTARIIGEDGEQKVVRINDPNQGIEGQKQPYMLDNGKYDVTVDVGPSFQTKRQEAVASMIEFTKSMPQVAPNIADIMARNMDWPGASELAERFKKMLPPQLQGDNDKTKAQQVPPQVQQQMQQMGQMVDQLTSRIHALQSEKEQKLIEIESKERIEMAKIQRDIEIALAQLGSKESIELLRQEVTQIEGRLAQLNFNQPIDMDPQPNLSPMQQAGGQPALPSMGQNPTGGVPPGQTLGEHP